MSETDDNDVDLRLPRVRFPCSELRSGAWLRRYLPPPGGWEGETTQIYQILAVDRNAVLLKSVSTGQELTRRRSYLAMSAYWELL